MRNFRTLCEIFGHVKYFAHCKNFRACAKFFCCVKFSISYFQPRTTPFCLFSYFALDVILLTWVFLVFYFIARLYIAILYTVDLTDPDRRKHGCFVFTLRCLSLFLSFSLTFSAIKHSLENDNSKNAWLNPPHP